MLCYIIFPYFFFINFLFRGNAKGYALSVSLTVSMCRFNAVVFFNDSDSLLLDKLFSTMSPVKVAIDSDLVKKEKRKKKVKLVLIVGMNVYLIVSVTIILFFTNDTTSMDTAKSFDDVPQDLYLNIIEYLEMNSTASFAVVNKRSNREIQEFIHQKIANHYKQAIDVLKITINDILSTFTFLSSSNHYVILKDERFPGLYRGITNKPMLNNTLYREEKEYFLSFKFPDIKKTIIFFFNETGIIIQSATFQERFNNKIHIPFPWSQVEIANSIVDNEQNIRLLQIAYNHYKINNHKWHLLQYPMEKYIELIGLLWIVFVLLYHFGKS